MRETFTEIRLSPVSTPVSNFPHSGIGLFIDRADGELKVISPAGVVRRISGQDTGVLADLSVVEGRVTTVEGIATTAVQEVEVGSGLSVSTTGTTATVSLSSNTTTSLGKADTALQSLPSDVVRTVSFVPATSIDFDGNGGGTPYASGYWKSSDSLYEYTFKGGWTKWRRHRLETW